MQNYKTFSCKDSIPPNSQGRTSGWYKYLPKPIMSPPSNQLSLFYFSDSVLVGFPGFPPTHPGWPSSLISLILVIFKHFFLKKIAIFFWGFGVLDPILNLQSFFFLCGFWCWIIFGSRGGGEEGGCWTGEWTGVGRWVCGAGEQRLWAYL